jgi:conjugative transfer signal peptidase TraF
MSSPRVSSWAALCWLLLGTLALAWTTVVPASLRLVYNASDSAPRGFYMVRPAVDLRVGDYVVARLPEAAARFADARGYLPRSVPVLKQIVATEGHVACVRDGAVALDDVVVAQARRVDGQGRRLAPWNHCRRLVANELFLLNLARPDSFDSRYFGPVDASFVRGRAIPLFVVSTP